MKYLDKVKVLTNNYEKFNIFKNDIGHILSPEIRDNCFLFYKENPITFADEESASIKITDLELISESHVDDKDILNALPNKNPAWWCKVENGFIKNLKGEIKNKVPYDYNN